MADGNADVVPVRPGSKGAESEGSPRGSAQTCHSVDKNCHQDVGGGLGTGGVRPQRAVDSPRQRAGVYC